MVEKSKNIYSTKLSSIYYDYNNALYIFNKIYLLKIKQYKDLFYIKDENLGIDISEESLIEAVKSFYSEIDMLWNVYSHLNLKQYRHSALDAESHGIAGQARNDGRSHCGLRSAAAMTMDSTKSQTAIIPHYLKPPRIKILQNNRLLFFSA